MMVNVTGKLATVVVEGLKSHPISLPLVVINMMCLLIVAYTVYNIAERTAAKDLLIAELSRACNK